MDYETVSSFDSGSEASQEHSEVNGSLLVTESEFDRSERTASWVVETTSSGHSPEREHAPPETLQVVTLDPESDIQKPQASGSVGVDSSTDAEPDVHAIENTGDETNLHTEIDRDNSSEAETNCSGEQLKPSNSHPESQERKRNAQASNMISGFAKTLDYFCR